MTRRERLERKVERRQDWAAKRRHDANAVFKRNEPFTSDYAFNTQPGHIPLRARIIRQEERAFESLKVAAHHESKAAGLEAQLDKSIYSDDADAIEALEARIAEREAERERMKTINKLYRKGDGEGLKAFGLDLEALREKLKTAYSWCQQPHPAYELQNLGGRITNDRKRLEYIKRMQETKTKAEEAPGGVTITEHEEYLCVTFAEKPARAILDLLKAAAYRWSNPSWYGHKDKLPEEVRAMTFALPNEETV